MISVVVGAGGCARRTGLRGAGGWFQGAVGGGARLATRYAGRDIGAKVNTAIADVGCGTVLLPSGYYRFATTIVKPRCVWLRGMGAAATVLRWDRASGAAVVVGDQGGANLYAVGGISDLAIVGGGGEYGSGSGATGLWLGGDPAGVVAVSDLLSDFQRIVDVSVSGFGVGVRWGSNAWLDEFRGAAIFSNRVGVTEATGTSNSAEQNVFVGGAIFNNRVALEYMTVDLYFLGTSFDYNLNPGGAAIIAASFRCDGCHFEQQCGPVIDNTRMPEHVWLRGGMVSITGTSACSRFVIGAGGDGTILSIDSVEFFSASRVDELINWSGGDSRGIFVENLAGNVAGRIARMFQPGFCPGGRVLGGFPVPGGARNCVP